jgi:hypothetical protein
MRSCYVCNRPVMGFIGQDTLLNPVILAPDDPLSNGDYFGETHWRCLLSTNVAVDWSNRSLRHWEASPQVVRIYSDSQYVGSIHEHTMDTLIIRHEDGMKWRLRGRDYGKIHNVPYGYAVKIDEEFNLTLPKQESLVREVQDHLSLHGEMSILDFLNKMNLTDKIYDLRSLVDGKLVMTKRLKKAWTANGVSVRASYSFSVPDIILPCLQYVNSQNPSLTNRITEL